MDGEIDWMKIAFAIEQYKLIDWQYIEVPWRVPLNVQRLTFPPLEDSDKVKFVGSAEQSFLYLFKQGELGHGRYMACTPCSRKEPAYDRLHKRTFVKVELFQNVDVSKGNLSSIINDAYLVLHQLLTNDDILTTVKTVEGWDIELNGIEVGSYGIRSIDGMDWMYGTGIAEPRFSTAMMIGKENDYQEPKF